MAEKNESPVLLTQAELDRAKILAEIKFHDEYLHCNLSACEIEQVEAQPGQTIHGLIDIDDLVLFPAELHPLAIPAWISFNGGDLLAVSAGQILQGQQSGNERSAMLAQIVAIGSIPDEGEPRLVIVKGLRRIRFKQTLPRSGVLVDFVDDELWVQAGEGWKAKEYYDRLVTEELNEDAFIACAKIIPLSEPVRCKFLEARDPLARRLFIRAVEQAPECPIYCNSCLVQSRKTIIAMDARKFRSKATCINPSGFLFHMVLYNEDQVQTSNLVAVGPSYLEHTWFAGFSWSFCMCRRCHAHLGWRYLSTRSSLFGRSFYGFRSTAFANSEKVINAVEILT